MWVKLSSKSESENLTGLATPETLQAWAPHPQSGMLVGYAHVSTEDQNLDLQKDALQKAGCEKLFTDVASGAKGERAGLAEALAYLRPGDTLVVWKLDRLGARCAT